MNNFLSGLALVLALSPLSAFADAGSANMSLTCNGNVRAVIAGHGTYPSTSGNPIAEIPVVSGDGDFPWNASLAAPAKFVVGQETFSVTPKYSYRHANGEGRVEVQVKYLRSGLVNTATGTAIDQPLTQIRAESTQEILLKDQTLLQVTVSCGLVPTNSN